MRGRLATGTSDGLVQLWNLDDQEPTPGVIARNENLAMMVALPDGRLAVAAFGGEVGVLDPGPS